jgi:hypothetical protein
MKIRLAIAALWGLSLVLVFLMTRDSNATAAREQARLAAQADSADGFAAGNATGAAYRTAAPEIRTIEKIVVVDRSSSDTGVPPFNEISDTLREIDAGEIGRLLPGALMDGGDVMANNLVVAEMLAGLTPENVHAALAAFEGAERNHLNDHNFRMFMFAWGKIDGKAATEYAFFNEDGKKVHYAGSSAIMAWGQTDPEAARAYIDSVDDENRSKGYMVDALVRGWADRDLHGAGEYVGTLPQTGGRKKLIEHLAQEHIKQNGPHSALAWADQVAAFNKDPEFAANVVSDTAFYAARNDPMATRDWVENNLDSPYLNSRIFEEVADEMMEIDPAAASRFLDTHFEDDRVNGKVIAEMTEEWANTDPAAAAEWVNQYMGHKKINSEVVHELAGEWADSDPDAAINWVAGLKDDQLKRRGLASAVDHWARKEPAEVGDWLNKQTQRGDLYDPAIEVYANRIVRESPIAALSWAQQIQNEGTRERTSVRAGQALFRTDEDAVLAWLPSSGLSERAQNAILNPPRNDNNDRRRR